MNTHSVGQQPKKIGSVLRSERYDRYIVQLTTSEPLGQLVQQLVCLGEEAVGLVTDLLLVNDSLQSLSSYRELLAIQAPDLIVDVQQLLTIQLIGSLPAGQQPPSHALEFGAAVRLVSATERQTFHRGPDGQLQLCYLPQLTRQLAPDFTGQYLETLSDQLTLNPAEQSLLAALASDLSWQQLNKR